MHGSTAVPCMHCMFACCPDPKEKKSRKANKVYGGCRCVAARQRWGVSAVATASGGRGQQAGPWPGMCRAKARPRGALLCGLWPCVGRGIGMHRQAQADRRWSSASRPARDKAGSTVVGLDSNSISSRLMHPPMACTRTPARTHWRD